MQRGTHALAKAGDKGAPIWCVGMRFAFYTATGPRLEPCDLPGTVELDGEHVCGECAEARLIDAEHIAFARHLYGGRA